MLCASVTALVLQNSLFCFNLTKFLQFGENFALFQNLFIAFNESTNAPLVFDRVYRFGFLETTWWTREAEPMKAPTRPSILVAYASLILLAATVNGNDTSDEHHEYQMSFHICRYSFFVFCSLDGTVFASAQMVSGILGIYTHECVCENRVPTFWWHLLLWYYYHPTRDPMVFVIPSINFHHEWDSIQRSCLKHLDSLKGISLYFLRSISLKTPSSRSSCPKVGWLTVKVTTVLSSWVYGLSTPQIGQSAWGNPLRLKSDIYSATLINSW